MSPPRCASNSRACASPSPDGDVPFGRLVEGPGAEAIEKLRIDFAHARDHFADHRARFGGRVRSRLHAPQAVQHDAGNVCTMVVAAATGRT